MTDFFGRHYAEVESSCNESTYVYNCVKYTKAPEKFRSALGALGVMFLEPPRPAAGECTVRCSLPSCWQFCQDLRDKSKLVLKDADGNIRFSAHVTDTHGYAHWIEIVD